MSPPSSLTIAAADLAAYPDLASRNYTLLDCVMNHPPLYPLLVPAFTRLALCLGPFGGPPEGMLEWPADPASRAVDCSRVRLFAAALASLDGLMQSILDDCSV